MSSCSPPARGRGTSRMPGSAEHVGSPAPQVTDRAAENGTRCPTRPGADSIHPCPSRRPAPRHVPRKTPNPSPQPPSSSQRRLGSPGYRALQAPREALACAGVTICGSGTKGRKAGQCSRRDAKTAEGSHLPYRCDPSPRSDIKRNAASHEPPPRPPCLCAQTPWPPSQKRRAAPRLPATTYRPLRPLPRALRVTFHRPAPKSHPEPTHSRVCP